MQSSHKYLSNLTTLRGIAAVWVAIYHFQILVVRFIFPEQTHLIEKGYLMVDLFFVMSGFIICHVYQKSFLPGLNVANFRRFIVARFARIYPLHLFTLVCLIIYIAFYNRWDQLYSAKTIPANIFLLHSFGVTNLFGWNVPSWSISAEWWAYMVFPVLIIFIHKGRLAAILILALLAITAYIAIIFWIPRFKPFTPKAEILYDLNTTYDFGFLRGLAGFISGIVLYKVYESGFLTKIFRKDLTALLLILVTILSLHFGVNDGICVILFMLLVLAFALNDGRLHLFCNFGLAQWVGKISYSIYLSSCFLFIWFNFDLIRLPGINFAQYASTSGFWLGLAYCIAFLLLLTGISTITYYIIEKPFRKYINNRWGKETMPVYA